MSPYKQSPSQPPFGNPEQPPFHANDAAQGSQHAHQRLQSPSRSRAIPPDSPVPDPAAKHIRPLSRAESAAELEKAIADTNEIMAQATTVFPFSLFPDTITVDRTKVTVIKRFFFRMAEVSSFRIEDILSTSCTVGPFFGGVKLVGRVMNQEQEITIAPFPREEAERLKRIIHGYVIAKQRGIDTSQLGTKELTDMLDRLGHDEH